MFRELQRKYDAYLEELSAKSQEINRLIEKAFDDDFRIALRGSIDMARAIGVNEKEILKSIDEVDEFFM